MFSFNKLVLSCAPLMACILLFASAWPQSSRVQAVAPANANAANPVTPQAPTKAMPMEAVPPRSGDTSNTVTKAAATILAGASPSDLVIGAGDLLEIAVFGAPDFDRLVRVTSTGEVSLPLIGSVRLAGLTTTQAEKLVEKTLSAGGYFADPQVSVFEKEYQSQGISVTGEVQKPGIYPMLGSRRLFDVISAAGGTTLKAGNQVTISHRDASQPAQTITLTGNGSDSTRNNPEVLPGDTVVVQKAGIVYVVGDVRTPGGFVMDKPVLTVLQALAMAQGTNATAKLDGARLIRRNGDQREDVPIALKKILSSQAPDVNLQADDILFVPNSRAKSALARGLEAIVQTATGVVIYSRPIP
jgi:polysaccharide biosynthesis/export protein